MFTYTTNGTEKTTLIKNIDFISCVDQAGEKLSKIFPIEDRFKKYFNETDP